MEIGIAVLSLMWVIGVLELQRIDLTVSDFTKSLASYLSVAQNGQNQGKINLEQYNLMISKSKNELLLLLKFNIKNVKRSDIVGLNNADRFFDWSERLKLTYETVLLVITIVIPVMYVLDFSKFKVAEIFEKDLVLLCILTAFVLVSFLTEKTISIIASKNYPIRFESE